MLNCLLLERISLVLTFELCAAVVGCDRVGGIDYRVWWSVVTLFKFWHCECGWHLLRNALVSVSRAIRCDISFRFFFLPLRYTL